jgi:hypothetical protein
LFWWVQYTPIACRMSYTVLFIAVFSRKEKRSQKQKGKKKEK